MIRKLSVPLLLYVAMTSTRAAGPTIAIDAASPAGNVSRLFYGLMTEEINHSYDGGLYAELVQNRAFLDDADAPAHWFFSGQGTMMMDRNAPVNDALPVSLRVDLGAGTASVANDGYWGIPVRPHT